MNGRNISLIVVLLLAPVALWYWMQYCGNRMLDTDYAQVGDSVMFQKVVGIPLPKGVVIEKVAGHHGLGTGKVWMKFTGDDKSLKAIVANMAPLRTGFTYTIPTGNIGAQKAFREDAVTAKWDEVSEIAKPDAYLFRTRSGEDEWDGNVVLSPGKHTGYLSGSLVSGG